ncbi:hypothetical protein V6N13_092170 [Hibiscus sabdariffa]|uniref:Uncharacterized protein n=1 Tax=Hibiscus sabdariffa TaxID=183260 RepID=A0ABR2ANG3_9ROSI
MSARQNPRYSEEDKNTSIYPSNGGFEGPKAIVMPQAEATKVYMMFQAGLIKTIYFRRIEIFDFFPANLKKALTKLKQTWIKDHEGFIRIFSTIPFFSEGEDKTKNKVIIPAIQLCQVGFSNGTYPDMEDNFLILWSQSRKTSDLDKSNFTKMFKNLVTIDLKIPRVIKVEICLSLQQQIPDKHVCQICLDEASTDAPLSSDKTKM